MNHLGNVPANSTLYIPFATYDGATGASEACSGLAVTDIEIYKNGSTTQRASDSGYSLLDTDGIDFDGLVGINGFSVDLSDNADAGFYSVGGFYWVVVSSITADGQTVNFIAATFRIVAAEAVAGKPKVDVDAFGGSALTQSGGRPEVNTTHAAGTAWNSGAIAAATLAADTLTAAKVAADVGTEIATAVWAATTRLLTAGTNIVLAKGAGVTGFNDLSAAQVNAEVDTALADYDAPTNAELVSEIDAVQADIAALNNITAAAVADAVWDEATLGHTTSGTFGEQAKTDIDAILADTNELQTDWVNGGRLDVILDARASQTSVDDLPTNAELTTALGTLNDLSAAEVNAEVVDALATDTYAEPGQGAPAATASLAAKINYLFKAWRNKKTQTATTHSLFDDAGTTVDQKSTVSDDGTTATRGEMVAGP